MNSNKKVACPMDCFDACQAEVIEGNIKGTKENKVTNGKLCGNFASLLKEDYLKTAKYEGNDISLKESLDILEEKLKNTEPSKTLYYDGSGNLGVMQKAPKNFFSQYGSILTKGSLCDGGGGAGIEAGRQSVVNPPIDRLIDSDVIIVWGRNFTDTSSHMYNLVKDKTFITIDPVKTKIAKKSELHMQINPKTDYELALMLTRLAHMNNLDDEEYLEDNTEGHDWFFDIAKNRPLVSYEATTGVELDEVYKFFDLIENKKVAVMLGLGVQKYFEGSQIMRCIDSFCTYIGFHHQEEAGGVWYLSDSAYGYEKQFAHKGKNKKVSLPEVDFSSYDLVFIQGANPVVSAPNTSSIVEGLKNSFVVYYGTTFNDTCEYANLVIPSPSFLTKKDVRLSYGHEFKSVSEVVEDASSETINEYNFAKEFIERFDLESLKDEDEVIDYYVNHKPDINYDIDSFEFIEDLDIEPLYKDKTSDNFYLITAKNKKSLNSQFFSDNHVYLNSSSSFKNGDEVSISSKYGQAQFIVKINDDIKDQCAFFYAGNKYVNYLTTNKEDEDSFSAMYQEVLIQIELS